MKSLSEFLGASPAFKSQLLDLVLFGIAKAGRLRISGLLRDILLHWWRNYPGLVTWRLDHEEAPVIF